MPTIIQNQIQQPQPFDVVGDPVRIAGVGQGFEAVLNWRVHDGHDERTGFFSVGGGTGEHGQFQIAAAIGNAAFQLDRIFVEVFEESAADHGSWQTTSAAGCTASSPATRCRRSRRRIMATRASSPAS
jgi:hypothetical protein